MKWQKQFKAQFKALLALCAVIVASLAPVAAFAQQPSRSEAITVSTAAVSIASSTYNPAGQPAQECFFTLADAQIRWTVTGVAPTASTGHVYDVGGELRLKRQADYQRFQAIRTGSTDGVLTVTCLF